MPVVELLIFLAFATSSDDERAASAAIRSGDRSAFRRFFEAHKESLLRYLISRKVDADTAEDLVQNAFIHIWENRATIRDDGSLRGLLFRIAYTRALNHFRDSAKITGLDPAEVERAGPVSDPAHSAEVRDLVARAVAALPERRRAVFDLCVLQGFSYREASEALEISPKTVENHMGYALKTVREHLQSVRE